MDKFVELLLRIDELEKRLVFFERENATLREKLAKYENPKNSRNSSIPPSNDQNRPKPNQSLRKKTGRKPGGQKGRKGNTLRMVETPDEVVELSPEFCNCCGCSLTQKTALDPKARQVIDIPIPKPVCIEYRSYAKVCRCGHTTRADFPEQVNAPVKYGPHIESLIGYFHARQYLPFDRMKELFHDVFQLKISEGGIHHLLNRFSQKTEPVYKLIKEKIKQAKVLGSDETGVNLNGKNKWFWTWQSSSLTYIAYSDNRGNQTVETEFPGGFPSSTLVRDGWRPQASTPAQNHQICLAHLQRNLNYLIELYKKTSWAKDFKKLLLDALYLHKNRTGEFEKQREHIIRRFDYFLEHPPNNIHKELFSFYKRITREAKHLFTFLFVTEVPPDNNGSERAIRNVKVKQKISGQFKSPKAAQNFAQIRSVIDTTLKNNQNVMEAFRLIANPENF